MKFWLVVPAAGSSQRFGGDQPKQFLCIDGISVLTHTLNRFLSHPDLLGVQVVLPQGQSAPDDLPSDSRIQSCTGGDTRRDSVLAGCQALTHRGAADTDRVLVHDAARPLLPRADIDALLQALTQSAAYLVAPVADTLRDHQGQTLDRDGIHRVLTPQGAELAQMIKALEQGPQGLTDEAAYLLQAGVETQAVVGDGINQKITWPRDLALAQALMSEVT